MAAALSQLVGWVVIVCASLPELVLAGFAVSTRSTALGVAALVVGVALGAAALAVGLRLGSRAMDRGAPELLQRMVSFG